MSSSRVKQESSTHGHGHDCVQKTAGFAWKQHETTNIHVLSLHFATARKPSTAEGHIPRLRGWKKEAEGCIKLDDPEAALNLRKTAADPSGVLHDIHLSEPITVGAFKTHRPTEDQPWIKAMSFRYKQLLLDHCLLSVKMSNMYPLLHHQ